MADKGSNEYRAELAKLAVRELKVGWLERGVMSSIDHYWQALKRLQENKPVRLSKGTMINRDTVAQLEKLLKGYDNVVDMFE